MLWRLRHPSARKVVVHDATKPSGDPTGTAALRRQFKSQIDIRWRKVLPELRSAIIAQDVLGLDPNKQNAMTVIVQAMPSDGKIKAFQDWLDATLIRTVLEIDTGFLDPMIQAAYNRAVARAIRLTVAKGAHPIVPPNARDSINAMQQLVTVEMQGISEAVSQRLVREASNAILNKLSPRDLFKLCSNGIETIGINRSRALIEVMVSKAFTTGTLDQFEAAGIRKVGLIPETIRKPKVQKDSRPFLHDARRGAGTGPGSRISRTQAPSARTIRSIRAAQKVVEQTMPEVDVITAEDDAVCEDCDLIAAGSPYDIDTARSLIPAHPFCRCAFVPSGDARFGASSGLD